MHHLKDYLINNADETQSFFIEYYFRNQESNLAKSL